MNTEKTAVAVKTPQRPDLVRLYSYTNKTNKTWVERQRKKTKSSSSAFLDAVVTEMRKTNAKFEVPVKKVTKRKAAKKTTKKVLH